MARDPSTLLSAAISDSFSLIHVATLSMGHQKTTNAPNTAQRDFLSAL